MAVRALTNDRAIKGKNTTASTPAMMSVQFVFRTIGSTTGEITSSFAPEMYVCGSAKNVPSTAVTANGPLFFQTKAMASSPYLPITDNSSLLLGVAFNKPSSVTILNL